MPTKTTAKLYRNMMEIDPDAVIAEIYEKGFSKTQMARLLHPKYEVTSDAFNHFRYWMKNGRMPKEKYAEMRRILDGTV